MTLPDPALVVLYGRPELAGAVEGPHNPRVTDECLGRMVQSPPQFSVWVLRAALVELRARRALDGRRP